MDYRAVFLAVPGPCLLLDDQLRVLDANPAYEAAVRQSAETLFGRYVFDVLPGSASGQGSEVEASLRRALASGTVDRVALVQYDLEVEPGSGEFEARWWSLLNAPVLGPDGRVAAVLNAVQDVSDVVHLRAERGREREVARDLREHSRALEDDLHARSREVASLAGAEQLATLRLTGLAGAALRLASVETVEDLVDVVVGEGLAALGADGGAVAVRDEESSTLRLTPTASLGERIRRELSVLPLDSPLPAAVAARTGEAVLVGDRATGLRFAAEMQHVYDASGRDAWAALPLAVGDRLLGSLLGCWAEPQAFVPADVELLKAFAAQCAQVLDRILVRQAERQAATATRRMSEALQRSLLTDPPQPEHLQVVARYQPAAEEAQVGGDWYDTFVNRDGTTFLVIGDVAGHDQDAAASMAQVRNLLRGVAHVLGEPPAAVLSGLDRALADLAMGVLATAVLAQVEQDERDEDRGLRVLRWSNAGHPPPLLLHADGTAELLDRPVDLLLGLDPETGRQDHTQVLEPGATVLLYTDGLVERRGSPLEDGLEWLRRAVEGKAEVPLDELCDGLLAQLDATIEDDVAVLAVRALPMDRPRPPDTAGPQPGR